MIICFSFFWHFGKLLQQRMVLDFLITDPCERRTEKKRVSDLYLKLRLSFSIFCFIYFFTTSTRFLSYQVRKRKQNFLGLFPEKGSQPGDDDFVSSLTIFGLQCGRFPCHHYRLYRLLFLAAGKFHRRR